MFLGKFVHLLLIHNHVGLVTGVDQCRLVLLIVLLIAQLRELVLFFLCTLQRRWHSGIRSELQRFRRLLQKMVSDLAVLR